MFKNIDKKIKDARYNLVEANDFLYIYEKNVSRGLVEITLSKRNDGYHNILSTYIDTRRQNGYYILSVYETDLFVKKMKKLGWYKDAKKLIKCERKKKKYEYTIHKLYKRTCN